MKRFGGRAASRRPAHDCRACERPDLLAVLHRERATELLLRSASAAPEGWSTRAAGTVWSADGDFSVQPSSLLPTLIQVTEDDERSLWLHLEAAGDVQVWGEDAAVDSFLALVHEQLSHSDQVEVLDAAAPDLEPRLQRRDLETCAALATSSHRASFFARLCEGESLDASVVVGRNVPTAAYSGVSTVHLVDAPTTTWHVECRGDGVTVWPIGIAGRLPQGDLPPEAPPPDQPTRVETNRPADATDEDSGDWSAADADADADSVARSAADADAGEEAAGDPEHLGRRASEVPDVDSAVLVNVLGPVEVIGPSGPLSPKSTELVVYLALHGSVREERLRTALWPERDARSTFNNTVSRARYQLGHTCDGSLRLPRVRGGHYEVHDVVVDRDVVEGALALSDPEARDRALEAALQLVRGVPFEGATSWAWVDDEHLPASLTARFGAAAYELAARLARNAEVERALKVRDRGAALAPEDERFAVFGPEKDEAA